MTLYGIIFRKPEYYVKRAVNITVAVFMCLPVIFVFMPSGTASAQERSVRKLVIDLDHEYRRLDSEIKRLDEFVRGFPGMVLHLSVSNREPGLKLVSLDIMDKLRPLKSHIYTPIENRAMGVGARHEFYSGEISKGVHELRVVYYWAEGDGPPQKGEALVLFTVEAARSYFIELSLEKELGRKVVLRSHEFEFSKP